MIDFLSEKFDDSKPIRFVIPSYQRGYRWREDDVEKLLKDLATYSGNSYCLQPLELQLLEKGNWPKWISEKSDCSDYIYYRVVDGQQRLTTVFIISKILDLNISWEICYNTEQKLLSEILTKEIEDITINDFFRKQVYRCAYKYIVNHPEIKQNLLNYFGPCNENNKIVFPIHFLDSDPNDPEGQEAFCRLNAGKTPLTSSELIRALYMVSDNKLMAEQRIEIAKEWELIESTLQNEQYWKMFNSNNLTNTPTRIDLLFALVLYGSSKIKWDNIKSNPRYIFETIENGYYYSEIDLLALWHEVIRCFWWIQSCYEDIETYNYLGWIALCTDNQPSTIYQKFLNKPSKEDFKQSLIGLIHENGICDIKLQYGSDPKLKNLLILLNILECNKSQERFRFDLLGPCDVEHIDSQTPNDLSKKDDRYGWLKSICDEYATKYKDIRDTVLGKIGGNDLSDEKLRSFCENEFPSDFVNEIYNIRLKNLEVDCISEEHALGNLVLLASHINRAYKNAVFPQKRKKIINICQEGSYYIPPCTIKVFMKFYTPDASCLSEWLKCDFESYQNAMLKLLDDFRKKIVSQEEGNKIVLQISGNTACESEQEKVLEPAVLIENRDNKLLGEISFTQLMNSYSIRVPKIQRLYVQGRSDSFGNKCLNDFAHKLVNCVTHDGNKLHLDMVYGIENGEIFLPLDGQQRLTTLLLLSWLCKQSTPEWHFDYEARRITEIFIKNLLKTSAPHFAADKENKITEYIEQQPWFLGIWKQDPGIAGMLKMLDSLYDKLAVKSQEKYFFENIIFVINYLDVSEKSYDHIFLKMNSRGRQLTPWENIKAVLDKALPADWNKTEWREKIDLKWQENLWNFFNPDIDALDDCMTDIIELAAKSAGYNGKVEDVFSFDQYLSDPDKKESVKKLFQYAEVFFDAAKIDCEEKRKAMTPIWQKQANTLDFQKRDSKFMKKLAGWFGISFSTNSDWMRVVWNIAENGKINKENFPSACKLIEELAQYCENILDFLTSDKKEVQSRFAVAQMKEEQEKAKKIKEGWQDLILEAEKHPLLHGNISAILWDDKTSYEEWKVILDNFDKFLPRNGNIDDYAERGALLLVFGDYSVKEGLNWIFGTSANRWETLFHASEGQTSTRVRPIILKYLKEEKTEIDKTTLDWKFYFIKYKDFFLKDCNCYRWDDCDFLIKKLTGTNLHAYNCNPFLAAIANNSYDGYWVSSSESGKIYDKERNFSMWIEGDKEKIFFCIEKDVNQIENIEIEIGEDVIEQGRRLLDSQ